MTLNPPTLGFKVFSLPAWQTVRKFVWSRTGAQLLPWPLFIVCLGYLCTPQVLLYLLALLPIVPPESSFFLIFFLFRSHTIAIILLAVVDVGFNRKITSNSLSISDQPAEHQNTTSAAICLNCHCAPTEVTWKLTCTRPRQFYVFCCKLTCMWEGEKSNFRRKPNCDLSSIKLHM